MGDRIDLVKKGREGLDSPISDPEPALRKPSDLLQFASFRNPPPADVRNPVGRIVLA